MHRSTETRTEEALPGPGTSDARRRGRRAGGRGLKGNELGVIDLWQKTLIGAGKKGGPYKDHKKESGKREGGKQKREARPEKERGGRADLCVRSSEEKKKENTT